MYIEKGMNRNKKLETILRDTNLERKEMTHPRHVMMMSMEEKANGVDNVKEYIDDQRPNNQLISTGRHENFYFPRAFPKSRRKMINRFGQDVGTLRNAMGVYSERINIFNPNSTRKAELGVEDQISDQIKNRKSRFSNKEDDINSILSNLGK